jgi:hypothetical protein
MSDTALSGHCVSSDRFCGNERSLIHREISVEGRVEHATGKLATQIGRVV